MNEHRYILALDQGTTSSRAILFDYRGVPVESVQEEFKQHYPQPGWVEHDPLDIWRSQMRVAQNVLRKARTSASQVAAIGIASQRETTILWDRKTGAPVGPAIVWQDRRTASRCESLDKQGAGPLIQRKTGLLIDPYFSATKLAWLLDNIPDARARAVRGELAFGTVDSWLVWNLSGGASHITDVSNASRTSLLTLTGMRNCFRYTIFRER
jgi:glycerol kinase